MHFNFVLAIALWNYVIQSILQEVFLVACLVYTMFKLRLHGRL